MAVNLPTGTAVIYALVDPREPDKRLHIGSTKKSIRHRLSQHINYCTNRRESDYWTPRGAGIRDMVAAGFEPAAVPIEVCALADRNAREAHWERVSKAEGHPLWGLPEPLGPPRITEPTDILGQATFGFLA